MQEGINEDHHEEEKVHRWEGSQNAGGGLSQGRWERFAVGQLCSTAQRGMCWGIREAGWSLPLDAQGRHTIPCLHPSATPCIPWCLANSGVCGGGGCAERAMGNHLELIVWMRLQNRHIHPPANRLSPAIPHTPVTKQLKLH